MEEITCPVCGEKIKETDAVYHKWDIGEIEERICEDCQNDEEI